MKVDEERTGKIEIPCIKYGEDIYHLLVIKDSAHVSQQSIVTLNLPLSSAQSIKMPIDIS